VSSIVSMTDIRKSFGEHEILCGVDLEVERGEVVGIIGPSGSGKTTMLRCVNMLEQPSSGRLVVDDQVLVDTVDGRVKYATPRELRKARHEIGMVFQRFNLFPHMTALQNIIEAPLGSGRKDRTAAVKQAHQLLERVGLGHKADSYPLQMSGGQQQRVAIARALAMEPRVMLFDEVTSAVDPEMAGEILMVMRDLAAEGMTMLVVTHEMGFAKEVADRVLFIDHGKVVEQGPAKQVLESPTHPRTQAFIQAVIGRKAMSDFD
jgi:polar amino acid transport system ATP-binding protein